MTERLLSAAGGSGHAGEGRDTWARYLGAILGRDTWARYLGAIQLYLAWGDWAPQADGSDGGGGSRNPQPDSAVYTAAGRS